MDVKDLKIGDVVFIHIPFPPFCNISKNTGCWANHVGVVYDIKNNGDVIIAESKIPTVAKTRLPLFLLKAKNKEMRVYRCHELNSEEIVKIQVAIDKYIGIKYDLGFDYDSNKMYCSKFVKTVIGESLGVDIGEKETLKEIFSNNSTVSLMFWKLWFVGKIPWSRSTVTPKSVFEDVQLISGGVLK